MDGRELRSRVAQAGWERLLMPLGTRAKLLDDGYLPDPQLDSGGLLNPAIVPWSALAQLPCIVVLGEPGMGKSTLLAARSKAGRENGEACQLVDLSDISDGADLRDLVSRALEGGGTERMTLYLDGLDECLRHLPATSRIVGNALQGASGAFVRIACRTADWPRSLQEDLEVAFGRDGLAVVELAPLTKADVSRAALAVGLDADRFLAEVNTRTAVPLAVRPLTLLFLLNEFERLGSLPASQGALFAAGMRWMCEEDDPRRGDVEAEREHFPPNELLAVAERVAALLILSGRDAVWRGPHERDLPQGDLLLESLTSATPETTPQGTLVTVDASTVQRVLETGIFSGHGTDRFGLAHQAYGEFLTAGWLARQLSADQVLPLISSEREGIRRVHQGLREVAAWLATLSEEALAHLLRFDPLVLLRSDVAGTDNQVRLELARAVLNASVDEPELRGRDASRGLARLNCVGLPSLLAEALEDRAEGGRALMAARIARACAVTSMSGPLAALALDPEAPTEARIESGHALQDLADDEARSLIGDRLEELEGGDGRDSDLFGILLGVAWPGAISTADMLALLDPNLSEDRIGTLDMFTYSLADRLPSDDLPVALEWLGGLPPHWELPYPIQHLAAAISARGWRELEDADIRSAFARAMLERTRGVSDPDFSFNERVRESEKQTLGIRRDLLAELVALIEPDSNDLVVVLAGRPQLIDISEDFDWLLEQACTPGLLQRRWATILSRSFHQTDPRQVSETLAACERDALLSTAFAGYIDAVKLDSDEAQKMREWWQLGKGKGGAGKEELLDPTPEERCLRWLDRCESGSPEEWWQLVRDLSLEPTSTHYGNDFEPDVNSLAVWEATPAIRNRIIEAAKGFLSATAEIPGVWQERNKYNRLELAGYKALRLLMTEDHAALARLSKEVWRLWLPIILIYPQPGNRSDDGTDAHSALVDMVQKVDPLTFAQGVVGVLRSGALLDGRDLLGSLDRNWDEHLRTCLLLETEQGVPEVEPHAAILESLLEHEVPEAVSFCSEQLVAALSGGNAREKRARYLAVVATRFDLPDSWPGIWARMRSDPTWALTFLDDLMDDPFEHGGRFLQGLTEAALGDFFDWLEEFFPENDFEVPKGVHAVTIRERIYGLPSRVVNVLAGRVSEASNAQLRRIHEIHPEWIGIPRIILEAEERLQATSWVWPLPEELLRLAADAAMRFVADTADLSSVVMESLSRLAESLTGEIPPTRLLWDECGKNLWCPKDEGDFCDWVAMHLRRDLQAGRVVVNREVQIRRRIGEEPGQRTDIHVDVFSGSDLPLKLIIEAKGSWNPDLLTSMGDQLKDRYMVQNGCDAGVYLVGWFDCNVWAPGCNRRPNASGLAAVTATLHDQARTLSEGLSISPAILDLSLREPAADDSA